MIDHILIITRDLDQAAGFYSRLGFQLTPYSLQDPAFGTANRCVMFGDNYIELISIAGTIDSNSPVIRLVSRGDGPIGIALSTDDAKLTAAALLQRGITTSLPRYNARSVDTGDGQASAAFTVLQVPSEVSDGLPLIFCQHHTRDVTFQRRWLDHSNGALSIAGLVIAANDPEKAARALARVLGSPLEEEHGCVTINAGSCRIEFVVADDHQSPKGNDKVPTIITECRVRVRDLNFAHNVLVARSVMHQYTRRKITISADLACGMTITMTDDGS